MIPLLIAVYDQSGHVMDFVWSGLIVLAIGVVMMKLSGGPIEQVSHKDGFLIVTLAWVSLALLGAVPFWMTGICHTVMDGLFESTSGLTTTGATVLVGLDYMPHSILFWRSMQEWVGGMGIIVLAVAVMPLLGIGGMQLFRAEVPGPTKDKLTARVTETAKVLWYIYLAMTLFTAVSLWLAGMGTFDAINHAMTTVAIGGFSTHDASIGYFHSQTIQYLIILFMLLAGINFTLHFAAMRKGFSPKIYWRDDEFRAYGKWLALLLFCIALLIYRNPDVAWSDELFNVVSIATTTGFAVSDYSLWSPGVSMLLLVAMFIGGCAGSTAGGMKVVRVLLLFRQGLREVRRLIHPHGVIHVKLGSSSLTPSVMQSLWGFFVLYMVCFGVVAILVAATGVDMATSISAAAACITNTGPGFGQVGPADNYLMLPDGAKAALIFAMILGRLEIFTFFVLLVPEFWRK
ncbi:MAG: potassium transporter TrkG [Mariprofundales bacterium]|nr:potassium transporter TrkG [Mariprofundales bacterium]